jgi:Domain of unknown function (DUF1996)/Carbohydrate binding module (family 6)
MRPPRSAFLRSALAVSIVAASIAVAGAIMTRRQASAGAAPAPVSAAHAGHGGAPSQQEAQAIVAQAALRGSEFRADCFSKGRGNDDPIVKPGQPGASHIHEFFGNRTTNAFSTLQSLSAGTSNCDPAIDLSAYWVPTLYKNGVPVAPETVTVYYQGITDPANARPFPRGLKIVVGNPAATSPDQNPSARWSCLGFPESSRDFLSCPAGSKLQTYLDFPTCMNGQLDSADHKSHMAFATGGIGSPCPSSHPIPVPRTEFLITYPVNGGGLTLGGTRNGVNVTNAPGYTFHGDFFNAWPDSELSRRVRDCINAGFICGTDGCPIGGPPCSTPTSPAPAPTTPAPTTPAPTTPAPPPGNRDAYSPIQAESYNQQSGVTVQAASDTGGGQMITSIANGDWILLQGVNFGSTPARQFNGRAASGAPGGVSGLVEVRLDSRTSAPIGSFAIANTGGWQSWRTVPTGINGVTGTHNVYITFTSGQPANYVNLNWISFGH